VGLGGVQWADPEAVGTSWGSQFQSSQKSMIVVENSPPVTCYLLRGFKPPLEACSIGRGEHFSFLIMTETQKEETGKEFTRTHCKSSGRVLF
jgi:hypothetical protein